MVFGLLGLLRRKRRRRAPARRRAQYDRHREEARALVHTRLTYWNSILNQNYVRVAIRNQRSRWGSCSSKRNLNFNYRILFLPTELADYIIVHELCHLIVFNHSPEFWAHVERVLPDYRERREILKKISPAHCARTNETFSI